ncbi:MAG: ankyrin repeat domain-containing protein, partial [Balneolaceae bacterium]|nr:ankyrin repeat domain-containing protein [Balneolaceae bacterium]
VYPVCHEKALFVTFPNPGATISVFPISPITQYGGLMMINKKQSFTIVTAILLAAFTALPLSLQAQDNAELFESVRSSDHYSLSTMLAGGMDINQYDRSHNTALMVAAKIGDRLVIETLLNNDADPNITNSAGATALMIAAKYGHTHVIKELLRHDADPLIQNNNGIRASRFAIAYGHDKVYQALLDAEHNALKGEKELTKTTS